MIKKARKRERGKLFGEVVERSWLRTAVRYKYINELYTKKKEMVEESMSYGTEQIERFVIQQLFISK